MAKDAATHVACRRRVKANAPVDVEESQVAQFAIALGKLKWRWISELNRQAWCPQKQTIMNAELIQAALEKVGNAKTLVNLVSRRVRQLNFGGGGISRPLVSNVANQGLADIALREIIEEKIGWEMPASAETPRPVAKKRKKH